MKQILVGLLLAGTLAFGQYKVESTGASPAMADVMDAVGAKVTDAKGKVICEIWMRKAIPTGPKSAEAAVTLPEVAHGTLMGVVSFAAAYSDRRGQSIKPGLYTLRYSYYPQNGDHQGVAPQRDFLLLTPADADKDASAKPTFKELTEMSKKASGTPHPCVFSFWKEDEAFEAGIKQLGEHDWVLYTKSGGIQLGIILVGKAEG